MPGYILVMKRRKRERERERKSADSVTNVAVVDEPWASTWLFVSKALMGISPMTPLMYASALLMVAIGETLKIHRLSATT